MAGPPQLSPGALAHALATEAFASPIFVQVLDLQHIVPKDGSGPTRTKVTVNDGMYKCTALLASQVKELVDNGQIARGAILQVNELVGNRKLGPQASNKKLLIFLNLVVVGNYPEPIGSPVPVPDGPPGPMQNTAATPGPGGFGAPPAAVQNGPPPPGNMGGPGMYGQQPALNNTGNGMYGAPQQHQQQQQGGLGPGMYGQQQQQPQQQAGPGGFGGPSNPGGPAAGNMYRPPAGGGAPSGGRMYGAAPAGPQYGMSGGPTTQTATDRIVPIKGLNPYIGRWSIKARVTSKGDIRRWSNPRTDGKLMSFDLVDKDGDEIRATAWNDQVDQYQDIVQVGQVLLISKAALKPRNAKFNNTPHEYEIYLERNSQIIACGEDDESRMIPHIMFNFRKLAELEQIAAGQILDVIAIVDKVDPWGLITKKNGEETRKRPIVLRDDSGRSVELTLWDKFCQEPGDALENMLRDGQHPVLAVKGARVGDFNGRSLSTLGSSSVVINPDRPETAELHNWFSQGGASMVAAPLSGMSGGAAGRQDRRVTFGQIQDEGLGMNEPAWVHVVGTVSTINSERGLAYPACTRDFNGRPCQKKLQGSEGSWYCERCNATVEQPAYRYLISLQAFDHTGGEYLTAFGDSGELIMGCPAEQMAGADTTDPGMFNAVVAQRLNTMYNFKLKVFMDTYNDEQRRKISISKVWEVDYAAEGHNLLGFIHKLNAGQPIFTAQPQGAAHNAPNRPLGGQGTMGPPNPMMGGGSTQYGGAGTGAARSPYGGQSNMGGGGWQCGNAGPSGGNTGGGFGGPTAQQGGGFGGAPGGGGGWSSATQNTGYQQQAPYHTQQGGNWGGGGGGMMQGGGAYGQNQAPGGFQQQQQSVYNQPQQRGYNPQPFNSGFC